MASSPAAVTPRSSRAGRLASAALLLSASILLSRLLGVARQVAIADVFGNTGAINAYFAAFRIPDTMFTLVSGNALAAAFVPVVTGLLKRSEREAWEVASSIFNTVVIALAAMALFSFIFAPQMMDLLVGYPSGQRQLTVDLTRIMLLQPIFLGAAAVVMAMLQTERRFLLIAVAPLIYNVAVIVGALFGNVYGVGGLAWFVVLGAVGQLLVLVPGVLGQAWRHFRFAIDWDLPGAREIRRLFIPRVVGLAAFQVMLFITLYLASRLPNGMVGAISYAWLVIFFPVAALGNAVGNAIFPDLSALSAEENYQAVRRTINRSLRIVLLLALPSSVGLIVLRRPVLNLLYHHGSFSSGDVERTAFAMLFFALAIAPLAMLEILPRAFYAMKDTRTPVTVAVSTVVLDAFLSILFVHLFPRESGQGGLALATAISSIVQAVWLMRVLEIRLRTIGRKSLLGTLGDTALASLIMGAVVYVFLDLLTAVLPQYGIGVLFTVALEIALGGAVFIGVLYWLGAPELWELRAVLPARLRR